MGRSQNLFDLICILTSLFLGIIFVQHVPIAHAANFNSGNIISDDNFINVNSMSEQDIQTFFEQKGSLLKDFAENGRRAAKIIYEAAHGHGDASGSYAGIDVTNTVSPKVILATIQKEEGLVEGKYAQAENYNQVRLDWAMGYGYTDSIIYQQYKGFTKQVENAAWMMRYNYEKLEAGKCIGIANASPSCVRVGNSVTLRNRSWIENDFSTITIGSRATAVLYRYTPYIYNGNYNFWYYFNAWFNPYECALAGQSNHVSLYQGDSHIFEVKFRNTGSTTWRRGKVFLGTDRSRDRIPSFIREGGDPSGWYTGNRVWLVENSVAPGGIGTFRFWLTAPRNLNPGTYQEYFRPVADGVMWMNDLGVYWNITVKPLSDKYHSQIVSQNASPTLSPRQGYNFVIKVKNTGSATWQRNIVHLGTSRPQDHIPAFIREDRVTNSASGWVAANRVYMQETSVAPGKSAHFSFWYTVPQSMSVGTYREYFRPVAEGITWMEDQGIYWEITVI